MKLIGKRRMVMTKIRSIEGIGDVYGKALESAGVDNQEDLLKKGATPAGRKQIAESSGLSEKRVLGFVNRADLARIKGIGEEYADLLERAGVETVPELAQRNAENLYSALEAANEEKKLVRKLPTGDQVSDWIKQAKALPRVIEY
jgi:predicted flap endonuclease-1-like 5' DNA nuclease